MSSTLRRCLLSSHYSIRSPLPARKQWKAVLICLSRRSMQTGELAPESKAKVETISVAMKAYLERAREFEKFRDEQVAEYEIGKRHLANIMGVNADDFTIEDINKAIEYLLPSGLNAKTCRPFLKHPDQWIPKKKAAAFGMDGRPFHSLFYTGRPNYFQLQHDIVQKMEALKRLDDEMYAAGKSTPELAKKVLLYGSEWMKKYEIEDILYEKITDREYEAFIHLLERFAELPYSETEKDTIKKYRHDLMKQSLIDEVKPRQYDEKGRGYVETEGKRRHAEVKVKVWENGSGEFTVNGKEHIRYFPGILEREQLMFPLQFTGTLGKLDIECTVPADDVGGPAGRAGAIRYAVSKALMTFVDPDMIEQMRLAGLLTQDPRRLERKKPGQAGARKKFTWKRR